MVLNTHNSYDNETTSDEEDAWEMVGDDENNILTTPLVAAATTTTTTAETATTQENGEDVVAGDGNGDEPVTATVAVPDVSDFPPTSAAPIEDGAVAKRQAMQSVMKDANLSPAERNKKMQDIIAGRVDDTKVEQGEEEENDDDDTSQDPPEGINELAKSLQLETDALLNASVVDHESEEHHGHQDGNASFVSGVSSITGDHHTVSEVDEDEKLEEKLNEDNVKNDLGDLKLEEVDGRGGEKETTTQKPDVPDEKKEEDNVDTSDPLVDTLSQMGFEKEQIEKAIGDLREAGATEIDADSVIGSMVGEAPPPAASAAGNEPTNPFQVPLQSTWEFVESTAQHIDNQHQLRHRTQRCVEHVGRSARELWSNVQNESQRFHSNLRETCDQADVHARHATTKVKYAASSAKESIVRANEEHRIAEKVATVAAVGGATLLLLGNPRAGVGAMAVAGASLAAGEAMKNSAAASTRRSTGTSYHGDHGLREGLHLD